MFIPLFQHHLFKKIFFPELPWSFYAIYYMCTILVLNSTLLQPMYLYITQYCLDYCGLYQVIQFTWFVIIQYNFKYCIFSTFSYKFQNKIFCFHTKNLWKMFCLRLRRESHSVVSFATPGTVACQVPLFMGFSRPEYWSG